MSGNSNYHMYWSQKTHKAFLLKVAGRKDAKGNWRYEDFDPGSKLGQNWLNGIATWVKDDMLMQMEKAEIIEV